MVPFTFSRPRVHESSVVGRSLAGSARQPYQPSTFWKDRSTSRRALPSAGDNTCHGPVVVVVISHTIASRELIIILAIATTMVVVVIQK